MDRSDSWIRMIEAFAKQQSQIALILQAKAVEAEKSRDWLCEYARLGELGDRREHIKQTVAVHERIVEIIDGIVKIENGIARNLKLLLNQGEDSEGDDGGNLFGNLFGGGAAKS